MTMNHQELVVPPLSRADIRKKARIFRRMFQLDNQLYFPIVEIMELMNSMPDVFHDFNMEVLEESEMKNFHGLTLPNGTIKIRNDVYIRAGKGSGTDRDTMAHELGHWLLHRNNRAHARLGCGGVPVYCTPEWQAKAFSGELLVPAHLLQSGMSVTDIKEYCGVSYSSAQYQLRQLLKTPRH